MDCPDCTAAAEKMHHGFTANCAGCCARAAARSPHFHRVRTSGIQDRAYRGMLEVFGLTHEQVKQAAERDCAVKTDRALAP